MTRTRLDSRNGLTRPALLSQNYSYSVAFWVNVSVDYTKNRDRGGYLAPLICLSSTASSYNGVEECVSLPVLAQGQLSITGDLSSSLHFLYYNLTLQQNQQYHIIYTYSSSEQKFQLYFNGQLINSSNDLQFGNPILRMNGGIPRLKLTLGSPSQPKDNQNRYQWFSSMCNWRGKNALLSGLYYIEFNGTMSDVRMYSRILTQNDINALSSKHK